MAIACAIFVGEVGDSFKGQENRSMVETAWNGSLKGCFFSSGSFQME